MSILYPLFYRQFGIRRLQNLLTPNLFDLTTLPRNSFIHYFTPGSEKAEVDTSLLYLQQYKHVVIDVPTEYKGETLGAFRRQTNVPARAYIREFLIANKEYRYLLDGYKQISDANILLLNNYNYLDQVYRYNEMPLTPYYRWHNSQHTLFSTINEIATNSERNHFVFINVPGEIPGRMLLDTYSHKVNNFILKVFTTPEQLFILELWKWLDPNARVWSIFNELDEKWYGRVNLVFTLASGRCCLLNLGYLNSWLKDKPNMTEFNSITQLQPKQLQLLLLKFIITLQSNNPEEIIEDAEKLAATPEPGLREREEVAEVAIPDKLSAIDKTATVPKAEFSELPDENNLDEASSFDFTRQLAEVEKDLGVLDVLAKQRLYKKNLVVGKTDDELIEKYDAEEEITDEAAHDALYRYQSTSEILKSLADERAEMGTISAAEYKKAIVEIENYNNMRDPYGSKQTVAQLSVIQPEELKFNQEEVEIIAGNTVVDKSMLKSTLKAFDKKYVAKVMKKDILAMIGSIQRAGVIVKSHEVEEDHSVLGTYENHKLELKPIDGASSVIRFRIPKINEDGTFVNAGNRYVMRKQRTDVCLRKINPSTVALTTYYGKTFVNLDQKKANSSIEWVARQINKASMSQGDYISQVDPANVFDHNFVAPYVYNALADKYKLVSTQDFTLIFDHTERKKLATPELLNKLEADGRRLVGFTSDRKRIVVDQHNLFYKYDKDNLIPMGNIYDLLRLPEQKAPVDFATTRLFSKEVPVVVILGYLIGIKKLLKALKVEYKVIEGRVVKGLEKDEYVIPFNNAKYVFSRKDKQASIILAGLLEYEKELRGMTLDDLESKDAYISLLRSKGMNSLYVREIELLDSLFVDSISRDILIEMGEPTTYRGLLMRACELLTYYHHPASQDMNYMRVRGYERIAGSIYKELAAAIRQQKNKIAAKAKVEMSPYHIWTKIMRDASIKLVEDINPVQNLKEMEVVTYVGEGGRAKDAMNKQSRAYQVSDMGIVSEATVDSGDVGINAYLSANPAFNSLRGIPDKNRQFNPTNILSTSALLAPGAINDDGKRVNFISVMNSHTISVKGYRQPYVRTGAESVIASRTNDMFAAVAEMNGKIISKTNKGIIVEYEDGSRRGVTLGRVFGKAEGSVYPHDIVTTLEVGDKVVKGDAIAFNSGFFEPDIMDRKRIIMKSSLPVRTMLVETDQTFEDSSAISHRLRDKLVTKTTKMKSVTVTFKQNVLNVVKPGQRVEVGDVLMIIEDEITSTTSAFDEAELATLRKLANQAPRSKYEGTIDKIEVFYHGDKADMTASLKTLADASDRTLADICRSSDRPIINGSVNDEYRVAGTPLSVDKAEIKIYITIETPYGTGDKSVFANQLKSVTGEIMDYDMTTESGLPIDAVFSYRAIAARIVTSPVIIGTSITLLKVMAQRAVELYEK